MVTYSDCPCGGDPFAPEHGISSQHMSWLGMPVETEAGFQDAIVAAAHLYGWKVYHTFDSRRSTPGFPDLVLVKDRLIFREVKTDTGRLTVEQREWLDNLKAAGADADIWRPADWDRIEKELSR